MELAVLMQAATDIAPWGGLGVGGAVAGVVLKFYRDDRRASEERYAALAMDFRKLITDNTAAITQNTEAVRSLQDHILNGDAKR